MLSVAMLFATLTGALVGSIILQHRLFSYDKSQFMTLWGGIAFAVGGGNYYALVVGRRWSRFEHEFKRLSNAKRVLGGIMVWVSLILFVAASLWLWQVARSLPVL